MSADDAFRPTAAAVTAALADAFADDPWARYTLGSPGHRRQRALARLMSVPVSCARLWGGVVATPFEASDDGDTGGMSATHRRDEVAAVGAWVPASARHVGLRTALRVHALGLPFEVGFSTMGRLRRDDAEVTRILDAHLTDRDAYLWVLGVRRTAQGRGMGRRIVDRVLSDAASSGHRRIVLHTDTSGNVEIYRRMGFTLVDEQMRASQLRCHVLAMQIGG